MLGAVVLLQEVPVQALERAEGGGIPGGGVLDVVAWQRLGCVDEVPLRGFPRVNPVLRFKA